MKSKFNMIGLLIFNLIASVSQAEFVVKQGMVELDFEDIDGYAFTIPTIDRGQVFDSLERLDNILKNLINMEHLAKYAVDNLSQQLDNKAIKVKANQLANRDVEKLFSDDLLLIKESKRPLLVKFYQKKLIVVALEKYYKDKIVDDDIIEISKEDFYINQYTKEKSYNIQYLVINYDEKNKLEKQNISNDLLTKIKQGELDFDKLVSNSDYKKYNIDYVKSINGFIYDEKNRVFSDIIFDKSKPGLVNDLIMLNKQFLVVNISKINPSYKQTYEDVKHTLLEKYRKIKATNDYNDLILSITQDPFEVNDINVESLRLRYSVKK